MRYIKLNNGVEMPMIGLGVLGMDDAQVRDAVGAALESGYRLVDTASRYYNEKAVGAALADAGVPARSCSLWFKDHGYAKTKDAFRVSMDNLRLDYLDLYLIHQPFNDYYSAWHAMETGRRSDSCDRHIELLRQPVTRPGYPQSRRSSCQPARNAPASTSRLRPRCFSGDTTPCFKPGRPWLREAKQCSRVQRWRAWRKRTEKPFRRSSCAQLFSVTSRLSSRARVPSASARTSSPSGAHTGPEQRRRVAGALGMAYFKRHRRRRSLPCKKRYALATGISTQQPVTETSARSTKRFDVPGLTARRCSSRRRCRSATTGSSQHACVREERRQAGRRRARSVDPAPAAAHRVRQDNRGQSGVGVAAHAAGRVRAIGVSNFMPRHIDRLLAVASVVPAVNQVEVHPYFRQTAVLAKNAEHGILSQAWSPIGGITFYPGWGKIARARSRSRCYGRSGKPTASRPHR